LLGRDITIYGDGSQTRAFCYVDDMIDGLMRLMKTADDVTGPINIGNPEEYSVRDLAAITIDLVGSQSRIVRRPLPEDDPRQRQPDISRARALLNWTPRTPLKEGLTRTIAYFEQLLREPGVRELVTG
jgi:UDP-glucuronate decarboxylase